MRRTRATWNTRPRRSCASGTKPAPCCGSSSLAERLASTRASAARFFKNHVVTQLYGGVPIAATGDYKNYNGFVPASWEFRAPGGSCIDAVNVTKLPGRLVLTGDHGTCVWARTDDMIAWARESIRSLMQRQALLHLFHKLYGDALE